MKVRLNVATQPSESRRRFLAGAVLTAFLGLVALVLLSVSVYATWRRARGERALVARYESERAQLEARQADLAGFFAEPQTKTVVDRAAFLNSLIDQRSFPWTNIFTDLEKVLPAGVRVVTIAPTMDKGQVNVKLVIGAASEEGKNEFLRRLQGSRAFSNIRVNAETPGTSAGQDRENVQLEAVYSRAGESDP